MKEKIIRKILKLSREKGISKEAAVSLMVAVFEEVIPAPTTTYTTGFFDTSANKPIVLKK